MRKGVLLPEPSVCVEREPTHSSASRTDECMRNVHECARDSPSLVCRGCHTTEHPDFVVWVAAETQRRQQPRVVSFLPAGRGERALGNHPARHPRLVDKSDRWMWGHTVP